MFGPADGGHDIAATCVERDYFFRKTRSAKNIAEGKRLTGGKQEKEENQNGDIGTK